MKAWLIFWWFIVGAVILLLLSSYANAHPPYETIRSDTGVDCCGNDDCEPLSPDRLRVSDDGSFEVLVDGKWFHVTDDAMARDKSPDGQVHWCPQKEYFNMAPSVIGIRCLILPQVM